MIFPPSWYLSSAPHHFPTMIFPPSWYLSICVLLTLCSVKFALCGVQFCGYDRASCGQHRRTTHNCPISLMLVHRPLSAALSLSSKSWQPPTHSQPGGFAFPRTSHKRNCAVWAFWAWRLPLDKMHWTLTRELWAAPVCFHCWTVFHHMALL